MTIFVAPISVADVAQDFQNDFFELSEDLRTLQVRFVRDFLQAMVLPQHTGTGHQGKTDFDIFNYTLLLRRIGRLRALIKACQTPTTEK